MNNFVRDDLLKNENRIKQARDELEDFLSNGYIQPNRSDLDDPNQKWTCGAKPDYTLADLAYFKGKRKNHEENSLENIVENLVKTWEMEATHKKLQHWSTVNHEKYTTQANGGKCFSGKESSDMGNYNWLFSDCNKDFYDSNAHTFESSHQIFCGAFPEEFSWGVLEVYSSPPFVCFSWRHWAYFNGIYKEKTASNNDLINMYGFATVSLDENSKICDLKIFFKPDEFLKVLENMN